MRGVDHTPSDGCARREACVRSAFRVTEPRLWTSSLREECPVESVADPVRTRSSQPTFECAACSRPIRDRSRSESGNILWENTDHGSERTDRHESRPVPNLLSTSRTSRKHHGARSYVKTTLPIPAATQSRVIPFPHPIAAMVDGWVGNIPKDTDVADPHPMSSDTQKAETWSAGIGDFPQVTRV